MTAVLAARAWTESDGAFRARITFTLDVETGDDEIVVAGSPDAVLDAVRDWLERFVAEMYEH